MNLQHLSNPLIIAVLHVFPASPIDTAMPQENKRLAARHVDAEKPAFPTRLLPIFKFCEHHQTGWNVRKCHGCHAKQHDNLAWKHSKRRGFPASPIDTATPQETQAPQDKTRGCRKTSILCETSGNFHSCRQDRQDKKTSFAASPIDTARPRENQRRETRQVGAPKRAFRARLPPIFTLCSFKIDVFLRVFLRT